MFDYNSDSFGYDTFSFKYFDQSNIAEDDYFEYINFDKLNIQVSAYPYRLLKQCSGRYLIVYSYTKYPYASINNTKSSNHFIGFKAYDENKNEITGKNIEASIRPKIKYSYRNENTTFKLCQLFKHNETIFPIKGFHGVYSTDEYHNNFIECSMEEFGEITLIPEIITPPGIKVWLIVLLSIIGAVVLIGVAYYIFTCCKRRGKESSIPDTETFQIMNE